MATELDPDGENEIWYKHFWWKIFCLKSKIELFIPRNWPTGNGPWRIYPEKTLNVDIPNRDLGVPLFNVEN